MLSVNEEFIGKGTESTWFEFECDTTSSFHTPPRGNTTGGTEATGNTTGGTEATGNTTGGEPDTTTSTPSESGDTSQGADTETEARQALSTDSNGAISVWESSPGATNVRDLRDDTRSGLLNFQREAGVDVVVTGGAESGPHASGVQSHANGYKVDIEDSQGVNNYIENNYTPIGNRAGDGSRVYSDNNGNYYVRESSHWDVCYNCSQPPLTS